MVWRELKETFQKLLKQCENSAHDIDCSLLRPTCQKAGRAFFEILSEGQSPFGLSEEFKTPPVAKNLTSPEGKPYDLEHYSEYWLCVLGFLAREGHIHIGNRKLLNTRVPISWAALDHEWRIAKQFFVDHRGYICEVCNGSIQTCKELQVKPSEWKPKKGYIGSKEIVLDYKVPRSTLQGWQKKDNPPTDRDPKTQEIWYEPNWFKKRWEMWEAEKKAKKSVT